VQSDSYFHAELGYLCPAPRLRRELRVACWAGLVGVVVGAASIIGLIHTDRTANPGSPVPPAAMQPRGGHEVPRQIATDERNEHNLAETSTGEGEAAAPLRSKEKDPAPEPGPGEMAARDDSPGAAGAAKARPEPHNAPSLAVAAPRTQVDSPTDARRVPPDSFPPIVGSSRQTPHVTSRAAPVWEDPPKLPRSVQGPSRPQKPGRVASRSRHELGSTAHAYERDSGFPRTVFWDWSR
jgi:hypothetical protein